MATKHDTDQALKQVLFAAAALKAPRIAQAAERLASQAADANWSHLDYLAAVLDRGVAARATSGTEIRIKAAGFPARKTLEDFDFDQQNAARWPATALASGAFFTEARNVVLLGRPAPARPTSPPLSALQPAAPATTPCSTPRPAGSLA